MTLAADVFNYCPKCGNNHFEYKKDRSFLCSKCDFHLYINAAAAVAAIIVNKKGEILLTRRAFDPHKGMLDLPGGFVDPMERAEDAICREVKEELNLNIGRIEYFTSFPNEYLFGGLTVYTLDLAYICELNTFDDICVADDVSGYEFYDSDSLPYNEIGGQSIKKIIYKYFN